MHSLVTWTKVVYALHAFSLLTGIIGTATMVGAFLTSWPSTIAVILNYIKQSEARGTWLESHFRWQIRTFWFGLLWTPSAGPSSSRPLGSGSSSCGYRSRWSDSGSCIASFAAGSRLTIDGHCTCGRDSLHEHRLSGPLGALGVRGGSIAKEVG